MEPGGHRITITLVANVFVEIMSGVDMNLLLVELRYGLKLLLCCVHLLTTSITKRLEDNAIYETRNVRVVEGHSTTCFDRRVAIVKWDRDSLKRFPLMLSQIEGQHCRVRV